MVVAGAGMWTFELVIAECNLTQQGFFILLRHQYSHNNYCLTITTFPGYVLRFKLWSITSSIPIIGRSFDATAMCKGIISDINNNSELIILCVYLCWHLSERCFLALCIVDIVCLIICVQMWKNLQIIAETIRNLWYCIFVLCVYLVS